MPIALTLGGWDALEFLLRHAAGSDSIRAACAARQVIAWCGYSSRGLPSAPADQAARLRDLFGAARTLHPGQHGWQLLEFILRTHRTEWSAD
jgi:hypothetical protein